MGLVSGLEGEEGNDGVRRLLERHWEHCPTLSHAPANATQWKGAYYGILEGLTEWLFESQRPTSQASTHRDYRLAVDYLVKKSRGRDRYFKAPHPALFSDCLPAYWMDVLDKGDRFSKESMKGGWWLGHFTRFLTDYYNVSLYKLVSDERGGLFKEGWAGEKHEFDGHVGNGDCLTFENKIGSNYEGMGPSELLGAFPDYGGRITNAEDDYDRAIEGIRTNFTTMLRQAIVRMGMCGNVIREGDVPNNMIAIVNLVKYMGEGDCISMENSKLRVYGEMVQEMIRAFGLLQREGWGGDRMEPSGCVGWEVLEALEGREMEGNTLRGIVKR